MKARKRDFRLAIFISAAILVFAGLALAAGPYIISDPDAEAIKYRLRLSADGGVTWGAWVEGPPVNQALKFDVSGTPRGDYKGEAQAQGAVEMTDQATGQVTSVPQWSTSAPFLLKMKPGKAPVKIRASEN